MIDIPDERINEIQQIVEQAMSICSTPGDTIKQLASELPDTEEFGVAVFMVGKIASVGRNDIIVNATMMMLSGLPVADGMDIITTLYINTLRIVDDSKVLAQYVETTKQILDELVPKPVNPEWN